MRVLTYYSHYLSFFPVSYLARPAGLRLILTTLLIAVPSDDAVNRVPTHPLVACDPESGNARVVPLNNPRPRMRRMMYLRHHSDLNWSCNEALKLMMILVKVSRKAGYGKMCRNLFSPTVACAKIARRRMSPQDEPTVTCKWKDVCM